MTEINITLTKDNAIDIMRVYGTALYIADNESAIDRDDWQIGREFLLALNAAIQKQPTQ